MISNIPEIVDSYLINPKTGFVKWTSPTPPDGFILLIHANNSPLTNLTVDGMARQVKLTPLSPNITYSVRIASVIRGKVTDFSSPVQLDRMNMNLNIKNSIWVMSIIFVVLFPLIIIVVATCIFDRIKNWDKARDIVFSLLYQ